MCLGVNDVTLSLMRIKAVRPTVGQLINTYHIVFFLLPFVQYFLLLVYQ